MGFPQGPRILDGTFALRPTVAPEGSFYYATDTTTLYLMVNTVWTAVGGSGGGFAPSTADYIVGTAQAGLSAEILLSTAIGSGTIAARPAVGAVPPGALYFATDVLGGRLYRSDGATWTGVSPSAASTIVTTTAFDATTAATAGDETSLGLIGTIPANALVAGDAIEIYVGGSLDVVSNATPGTLTIRLRANYVNFGSVGTQLLNFTALNVVTLTTAAEQPMEFRARIVVRTIGAGATFFPEGRFVNVWGTNAANQAKLTGGLLTGIAVDSTAAITLFATAAFSQKTIALIARTTLGKIWID